MSNRHFVPGVVGGVLLPIALIVSSCGLASNDSQLATQPSAEPTTTLATPSPTEPSPTESDSAAQPPQPASPTTTASAANPPVAPQPSDPQSPPPPPESPPAAPPESPPAPPPATQPPEPAQNDFPNLNLVDVATEEEVLLYSLAPSDKPFLLWFWAPH